MWRHRDGASEALSTLTWLLARVWGALKVATASPALPVLLLLGPDALHPAGVGLRERSALGGTERPGSRPDGTYCLFSCARDFSSAVRWSSMVLRLAAL